MKKVVRKVLLLLGVVAMTMQFVSAQGGFSYQAILRDANGNFQADKDVDVRITLSYAGTDYYQELHSVKTGQTGEFSLIVGQGKVLAGKFDNVPWNTMKISMKTQISTNGTDFVDVAETLIRPVPYSLYAGASEPTTSIVAKPDASDNDALFSVKDENGNLVFAVYPDQVKVFVNESDTASKARKSAFLVASRNAKGDDEIFSVSADGTQVYVDADDTKARKSAFLVCSRNAKAGEDGSLFAIDESGTQVYVDADDSKARKSAFLVCSRNAKDGEDFSVSSDGTKVYVDSDDKARKSAFLVASRNAKGDDEIFSVDADGTQVTIDDTKARKSAFLVASRVAKDGEDSEVFSVNGDGTQVYVDSDGKARKSAFLVASRNAKGDGEIFSVDPQGTQVIVGDDADKARKSAFLVASRVAKDGDQVEYLSITDDFTSFGVNSNSGDKAFTIVGLSSSDTLVTIGDKGFDIQPKVSASGTTIYGDSVPGANSGARISGDNDGGDDSNAKSVKMNVWLDSIPDNCHSSIVVPLTNEIFPVDKITGVGHGTSAHTYTDKPITMDLTCNTIHYVDDKGKTIRELICYNDALYSMGTSFKDTIVNFKYDELNNQLVFYGRGDTGGFNLKTSNYLPFDDIDYRRDYGVNIHKTDVKFDFLDSDSILLVNCDFSLITSTKVIDTVKSRAWSDNYGDGVNSVSAIVISTVTSESFMDGVEYGSTTSEELKAYYKYDAVTEYLLFDAGNYTWLWVVNSDTSTLYKSTGTELMAYGDKGSRESLYLSEKNAFDKVIESTVYKDESLYIKEYDEENKVDVYKNVELPQKIDRFVEFKYGDTVSQYFMPTIFSSSNYRFYEKEENVTGGDPEFNEIDFNYKSETSLDWTIEKGLLKKMIVEDTTSTEVGWFTYLSIKTTTETNVTLNPNNASNFESQIDLILGMQISEDNKKQLKDADDQEVPEQLLDKFGIKRSSGSASIDTGD